ncbi:uncharacterized protein [Elaeis guineensis]|uniref:uncharacterized protein isoform X2 n=1 Tax=Elaeis guineensis var. tenera TaxID=51953 RepID=UPI003C6D12C3
MGLGGGCYYMGLLRRSNAGYIHRLQTAICGYLFGGLSHEIIIIKTPSGLDSSLKISEMQKMLEMESQARLTKKDSELEFSTQEEEEPLIVKLVEVEVEFEVLRENRTLATKEIAVYAFYLAPLWFVTEEWAKVSCGGSFLSSFSHDIWSIYWNNDFAVLLKKFAGEEGHGVDVHKLFGYIGLFTLVALWWLGVCWLCNS